MRARRYGSAIARSVTSGDRRPRRPRARCRRRGRRRRRARADDDRREHDRRVEVGLDASPAARRPRTRASTGRSTRRQSSSSSARRVSEVGGVEQSSASFASSTAGSAASRAEPPARAVDVMPTPGTSTTTRSTTLTSSSGATSGASAGSRSRTRRTNATDAEDGPHQLAVEEAPRRAVVGRATRTDDADRTMTRPTTLSTDDRGDEQERGRRPRVVAGRRRGRGGAGVPAGAATALVNAVTATLRVRHGAERLSRSRRDLARRSRRRGRRSPRTSRTTRTPATAARRRRAAGLVGAAAHRVAHGSGARPPAPRPRTPPPPRRRPRRSRPPRADVRHGARSTPRSSALVAPAGDAARRARTPASALAVAWGFVAFESSKYCTPPRSPTSCDPVGEAVEPGERGARRHRRQHPRRGAAAAAASALARSWGARRRRRREPARRPAGPSSCPPRGAVAVDIGRHRRRDRTTPSGRVGGEARSRPGRRR